MIGGRVTSPSTTSENSGFRLTLLVISFSGLDPNQIAAEITRRVNLNPEFSDVVEGEVTLPPITLKQRDLKPEYSVQILSLIHISCLQQDELHGSSRKGGLRCSP